VLQSIITCLDLRPAKFASQQSKELLDERARLKVRNHSNTQTVMSLKEQFPLLKQHVKTWYPCFTHFTSHCSSSISPSYCKRHSHKISCSWSIVLTWETSQVPRRYGYPDCKYQVVAVNHWSALHRGRL